MISSECTKMSFRQRVFRAVSTIFSIVLRSANMKFEYAVSLLWDTFHLCCTKDLISNELALSFKRRMESVLRISCEGWDQWLKRARNFYFITYTVPMRLGCITFMLWFFFSVECDFVFTELVLTKLVCKYQNKWITCYLLNILNAHRCVRLR